ncbi:MAG: serine/threonine protein kinase [Planctomycetes bacterium]|nr:serine/threonine protein kinase [Planctomycetota bacterium]
MPATSTCPTENLRFPDRPGTSREASNLLGQVLGDYRILREVGRGGMGVVYEAVQLSLGRRVALKILPPHLAQEPEALDRFRREARSAARLHHTNIVPVFEVGRDESICFFAMQFIEGQGLDQYINQMKNNIATARPASDQSAAMLGHSVTTRNHHRQAARLAEQAAQALAYAHGRGIVHRDIKPSNLLLDGNGIVWISDFGLAKSAGENLTVPGDIVGTLRYMAPERFRGEGDQRADIYALGLTLYEFLLLRPAFQATDHAQVLDEVQRTEPPRPRSVDARVPRDLETIILKAIDKDPRRRYPSAGEMAEDLRRFLADEPILARRAGVMERTARAARRNPKLAGLVALVLVLVLTLIGGAGVAAYEFHRLAAVATREADQARAATVFADAARANADKATAEAIRQTEKAHEVSGFLLGLLEETDPLALAGRGFGARKPDNYQATSLALVDRATAELKTAFVNKPAVRAALLVRTGAVYVSFGQFSKAKPLLNEALRLRQELYASDHAELAESWHQLGYFHHAQFQRALAKKHYEKALAMRRRLFGDHHPVVADSYVHLGFLTAIDDDPTASERMLRQAMEIQAKHFGKKSHEYGWTLMAYLGLHVHRGEWAKVMPLLEEGRPFLERWKGPGEAIRHAVDAAIARRLGMVELAEEKFRQSLAVGEASLGPSHRFVFIARHQLAELLHNRKSLPAAEKELRLMLTHLGQRQELDSADAANCLLHLGRVLRDQKRFAEAEKYLRQAAQVMRRKAVDLGRCLHVLGEVMSKQGALEKAEESLEEAVAARCAAKNRNYYWYGRVLEDYAVILLRLKKTEKASAALRRHVSELERFQTPDANYHFLMAKLRSRLTGLQPNNPEHAAVRLETREKAVKSLRLALAQGYKDGRPLGSLSVLRPLHDHPDFKALIAKADKDKKRK